MDFLSDFFRRWLTTVFLDELLLHTHQLIDRLDHVHRNPNRPRLVGDGAGDRLADPPSGIGREFIAAAIFEFFDSLHQTHVSFLDEIEEREPAVSIFLGDGNHESEVGLDHLGLRFEGFLEPMAELLVRFFESLLSVPSALLDLPQLGDELLVFWIDLQLASVFPKLLHVIIHLLTEVFDDFLLVVKTGENAVESLDIFLKLLFELFLAARVLGGKLAEQVVVLAVKLLQLITELRQPFHVAFAGLDFLVEDHTVEALLALVEFIGEVQIGIGDETKEMKVLGDLDLRILDALGNFHFLLTSKQGHLAHLLEIHPDRIVEDVELLVRFDIFFFAIALVALLVFVAVDFGSIDDVELHVPETLHDRFDVVRIDKVVGQNLVDVVVSQVVLFFRELDELTDFFLDFRSVNPALSDFRCLRDHLCLDRSFDFLFSFDLARQLFRDCGFGFSRGFSRNLGLGLRNRLGWRFCRFWLCFRGRFCCSFGCCHYDRRFDLLLVGHRR